MYRECRFLNFSFLLRFFLCSMGCFAAFKNGDDASLPSLRSILATKQRGLPPLPAKRIKETNFCFVGPNVFRARSKLLRTVSLSFVKARPRALLDSSVRPRKENEEKETRRGADKRQDNKEDDDERQGCFLKIPSRQSSARFIVPVTHSGPITASDEFPSPPPLFPLPLPPGHTSSTSSLSHSPSASASTADVHLRSPDNQPVSGPLPLPCPANVVAVALREFSLNELAAGCQNFTDLHKLRDGVTGPVYKATLKLHSDDVKETEATVARTTLSISRRKWKAQVQSLARLGHPNLCKIIGFCYERSISVETQPNCKQRVRGHGFLVFESVVNGSLDGLLGDDQCALDWSTRLKIAIGAAEGLAFLHERGLRQIIYGCFKTSCIQVDATSNAKLSEYGLADAGSSAEYALTTSGEMDGEGSEKGHVKAFGLLLRELLFEDSSVSNYSGDGEPSVVGAVMKGGYSVEGAKMVSDLAARCLEEDSALRPSMRTVAQMLRAAQTPAGPLINMHTKRYRKKRSSSIG